MVDVTLIIYASFSGIFILSGVVFCVFALHDIIRGGREYMSEQSSPLLISRQEESSEHPTTEYDQPNTLEIEIRD